MQGIVQDGRLAFGAIGFIVLAVSTVSLLLAGYTAVPGRRRDPEPLTQTVSATPGARIRTSTSGASSAACRRKVSGGSAGVVWFNGEKVPQ